MGWIGASLRRLRDEKTAVLGMAVLVFATALIFGAAPRVLQAVSDAALHDEIRSASSGDRNVELRRIYASTDDDAPKDLAATEAAGTAHRAEFPPALAAVVEGQHTAVETPWWAVSGTAVTSIVHLRIQEDVAPHIRLVDGRMPTGQLAPLESDPSAQAMEAVINTTASKAMGARVGSTLRLAPYSFDPLAAHSGASSAVRIVGTYEVIDPKEDFWVGDLDVTGATYHPVGLNTVYVGTSLLVSPDSYPSLAAAQAADMPLTAIWRYPVNAEAMTSDQLDALIDATRRMESLFLASAQTDSVRAETVLRSGLLRLLLKHQAEWRSAGAVLSVAALGAAVVALATLAAVAVLASSGRRRTLIVSRSRGASGGQMVRAVVAEGLVVAVPAVTLAILLSVALVPVGTPTATLALDIAICSLTIAFLLAAVLPAWRSGSSEVGRGARAARRPSMRRLILETLVVCLALGGAILLRDRGIVGGSSTGTLVSADPLIVVAPVLAAIAAGIIVVRLYPLFVRAVGGVAARRKGLVPVLAVRRATRGGSAGPVLLILLATAAVGTFSSLTRVYLDQSAEAVAWQRVGAAYRIVEDTTGAFPDDLDYDHLPNVSAVARASWTIAQMSTGRSRQLATIELKEYQQVVAGTPIALDLPSSMLGEPNGVLPIIVSPGTPGGPDDLAVGNTLQLKIQGDPVAAKVVDVRTSFPGLPDDVPFMVASREQLGTIRQHALPPVTSAFMRAPEDDPAGFAASVERWTSGVRLDIRSAAADAVRASPAVVAVSAGVSLASLAAVAYGALAVAASLALAGAARRDESAQLKAVGLSDRQAVGLVLAEYGPTVVVAFAVGLALGLGLFLFLLPGLGLGAIIGSSVTIPVVVEPVALLVVLAAVGAIVVSGWVIGAILQRSSDQAGALRRGNA